MNKSQLFEAGAKRNLKDAPAARPGSPVGFLCAILLTLLLACGCELLQPDAPKVAYDNSPKVAAQEPAPPPQPVAKRTQFDTMMERLENRAPAPTITPRSEPISTATASPKVAASTPTPARATPPPIAEPLIIRATPPPPAPPRASAGQLMATNPPARVVVETPVVTPAPVQPPGALVFVGTHKPPPKSHAGLKRVLWGGLSIVLAAMFALTFAPVRERLVSLKVALTVFWSRGDRMARLKATIANSKTRSAWIARAKILLAKGFGQMKRLPFPGRKKETVEVPIIQEMHRPTPAELLLKKIGAPPSNDVSTSRMAKPQKQAETGTTLTARAETQKAETPKVEAPKGETAKSETAKTENGKPEAAKAETAKIETAKVEAPKGENPVGAAGPAKSVAPPVKSNGDAVVTDEAKPAAKEPVTA